MINITIKTDNAAFQEDCNNEVANILIKLANNIRECGIDNYNLRNSNGNIVGTCSYQNKRQQENKKLVDFFIKRQYI